jgi:hypothetical protein
LTPIWLCALIISALVSLHWLRAAERIKHKVTVLTYKVINGTAPRYLGTFELMASLIDLAVDVSALLPLIVC